MDITYFEKQLLFIREIDRIKQIFRQTYLTDLSRKENDAEHSWHLACMVMVLGEYAPEGTDLFRVMRMVLVHDIVEIDAGDTYLFDSEASTDKEERETKAAERIFGILPEASGKELKGLWLEFEEGSSREARFALLLDRFQPFYHNIVTEGVSWIEHRIKQSQVLGRMKPALEDFPLFNDYLVKNVETAVRKGWLKPD